MTIEHDEAWLLANTATSYSKQAATEYHVHMSKGKDARIAELEAQIAKTTQTRSVEALKKAYRKHVMMDESIGWDELGTILCNALSNEEGDAAFQAWSDSQNDIKEPV